jgi:hypothetical protein
VKRQRLLMRGRHWHDSFGIGLLEHGAQTSASERGRVDAHATGESSRHDRID